MSETAQWPHPAYRIETARLILRCYHPDDASELRSAVAASQDHLAAWMPWARELDALDQTIERIRAFRGSFDLGTDFVYGIYDRDSKQQIGGTGFHPRIGPRALEIGYWIAADRVRQGLATEAAAALTAVGFEVMGAARIEIRCEPANVASAGIPRRLDYVRVGELPAGLIEGDGSARDTLIFAMTPDRYPRTPSAEVELVALDAVGRRIFERS